TTGRKYLRGPRGTGFLYVRNEIVDMLDPIMLDLHAATWVGPDEFEIADGARRFENWETNYAAKIGLGVALDYALEWGIDAIWKRVQALGEKLRAELETIPDVTVRDLGQVRCGIVTFDVQGRNAVELRDLLEDFAVNVTVSGPSSTRLDMDERGLTGLIRASVHYYNTEAEIGHFCETLEGLVMQGYTS